MRFARVVKLHHNSNLELHHGCTTHHPKAFMKPDANHVRVNVAEKIRLGCTADPVSFAELEKNLGKASSRVVCIDYVLCQRVSQGDAMHRGPVHLRHLRRSRTKMAPAVTPERNRVEKQPRCTARLSSIVSESGYLSLIMEKEGRYTESCPFLPNILRPREIVDKTLPSG
ncbi:hypothetical protein M426DRAFT_136665 [Hypoxylon sp. CI-4A]|nr:hypothetical protein M426DRAFT_136665 [Hypoxylon sp. CI-4A]